MTIDDRLDAAFMIVAQPRSGSTLLAKALNNHPHLVCHDEIFSENWVEGYRFDDGDSAIDSQTLFAERESDPERFLFERVLRPTQIKPQIGFKVVYSDIFSNTPTAKFLMNLATKRRIRVIHLRRLNMLRCFVSVERMRQLGIVHSHNSAARNSHITLDQELFLRFALMQEGNSDFVNRSLRVIANPRYEHLLQGYNTCLDGLGVIRRPFKAGLERMSSQSLGASVADADSWVQWDLPRTKGFAEYTD